MGTTIRSQTPGAGRAGGRASARGRESEGITDQYDLLTAMLLGVAVGTVVTLLFRQGPKGRRPIRSIAHGAMAAAPYARKGLQWAGTRAAKGAGWARERGEELWDRVEPEAIAEEIGEYLAGARNAIDEVVSGELRDLRKAIKRRRKRLGI